MLPLGREQFESLSQKPRRMGAGVAAAAAAVDDDIGSAERFGRLDCLDGIGHALVKRPSITAGKPTRPQHAHHPKPSLGDQLRRRPDAKIRHLRSPD